MLEPLTEDSSESEKTKRLSNAQKAELRQEWVDELVRGCRTEADLFWQPDPGSSPATRPGFK